MLPMKKNSLYYISWSSSEGCLVCKMFLRNLKLAQFAVKFKRRAAKLKPKQASSVCDCARVRYLYLSFASPILFTVHYLFASRELSYMFSLDMGPTVRNFS